MIIIDNPKYIQWIKMIMDNLTKYELVRIIGERAHQLAQGAPPTVDTTGMTDALAIAKKELEEGTVPLVVIRKYPDGRTVEVTF